MVMDEANRRKQHDPTWGQHAFVRYLEKPRIPEDQYLAAIACLPDLIYERRYGLKIGAMVYTPRTRLEDFFRIRQLQLANALAWELLGRSSNLLTLNFYGRQEVQYLERLVVNFWRLAKAVLSRWEEFEELWPSFERLNSPWDWMLACCADVVDISMRNQGLLAAPRVRGKGTAYKNAQRAAKAQRKPLERLVLLEENNQDSEVLEDVDCCFGNIIVLEYLGHHVATIDSDCNKRFKPWFDYLRERTSAMRELERSKITGIYRFPDGLKNSRGQEVDC